MKKYDVVIHLGLPRTGSTFLQKQVFPKLDNVSVFGANNIPFDFKTKLSSDSLNIVSDENLSGVSATMKPRQSPYEIAKRLSAVFPNAKVIVVFRDKKKWIQSLYAQYVKRGGIDSFDEWFEVFKHSSCFLDFEKYKNCLHELFDEVLICDFIDLKNDSTAFVKQICNFINVDAPSFSQKHRNVKLDEKAIKRWRRFNRLFKSNSNPDGFLPQIINPLRVLRYFM